MLETMERLEKITVDICRPLQETSRGNRCMLVSTDYFSKLVELLAIMNQEVQTVLNALTNVFM
jgi:hypothetical protein